MEAEAATESGFKSPLEEHSYDESDFSSDENEVMDDDEEYDGLLDDSDLEEDDDTNKKTEAEISKENEQLEKILQIFNNENLFVKNDAFVLRSEEEKKFVSKEAEAKLKSLYESLYIAHLNKKSLYQIEPLELLYLLTNHRDLNWIDMLGNAKESKRIELIQKEIQSRIDQQTAEEAEEDKNNLEGYVLRRVRNHRDRVVHNLEEKVEENIKSILNVLFYPVKKGTTVKPLVDFGPKKLRPKLRSIVKSLVYGDFMHIEGETDTVSPEEENDLVEVFGSEIAQKEIERMAKELHDLKALNLAYNEKEEVLIDITRDKFYELFNETRRQAIEIRNLKEQLEGRIKVIEKMNEEYVYDFQRLKMTIIEKLEQKKALTDDIMLLSTMGGSLIADFSQLLEEERKKAQDQLKSVRITYGKEKKVIENQKLKEMLIWKQKLEYLIQDRNRVVEELKKTHEEEKKHLMDQLASHKGKKPLKKAVSKGSLSTRKHSPMLSTREKPKKHLFMTHTKPISIEPSIKITAPTISATITQGSTRHLLTKPSPLMNITHAVSNNVTPPTPQQQPTTTTNIPPANNTPTTIPTRASSDMPSKLITTSNYHRGDSMTLLHPTRPKSGGAVPYKRESETIVEDNAPILRTSLDKKRVNLLRSAKQNYRDVLDIDPEEEALLNESPVKYKGRNNMTKLHNEILIHKKQNRALRSILKEKNEKLRTVVAKLKQVRQKRETALDELEKFREMLAQELSTNSSLRIQIKSLTEQVKRYSRQERNYNALIETKPEYKAMKRIREEGKKRAVEIRSKFGGLRNQMKFWSRDMKEELMNVIDIEGIEELETAVAEAGAVDSVFAKNLQKWDRFIRRTALKKASSQPAIATPSENKRANRLIVCDRAMQTEMTCFPNSETVSKQSVSVAKKVPKDLEDAFDTIEQQNVVLDELIHDIERNYELDQVEKSKFFKIKEKKEVLEQERMEKWGKVFSLAQKISNYGNIKGIPLSISTIDQAVDLDKELKNQASIFRQFHISQSTILSETRSSSPNKSRTASRASNRNSDIVNSRLDDYPYGINKRSESVGPFIVEYADPVNESTLSRLSAIPTVSPKKTLPKLFSSLQNSQNSSLNNTKDSSILKPNSDILLGRMSAPLVRPRKKKENLTLESNDYRQFLNPYKPQQKKPFM